MKRAALRLKRSPSMTLSLYHQLIALYGTPIGISEALESLPARHSMPSVSAIEDELASLEKQGVTLCGYWEESYPALLKQTNRFPPLLFMQGRQALLQQPMVSIVGNRYASAAGLMMARRLAGDVGAQGYSIVSGFARGIDTEAHRHSLATGTIAVFAGGLSYIYPKENAVFYEEIREKGLILSEHGIDDVPQSHYFPLRNRIIAGLSLGTVVVEASVSSGSLITARYAGEYNREIFAVPGSPLDKRAGGPNKLLKEGAHVVEEARDIYEIIQGLYQLSLPLAANDSARAVLPLSHEPAIIVGDNESQALWQLLGASPLSIHEILQYQEFRLPALLHLLTEWELAGRVRRNEKGDYCRA